MADDRKDIPSAESRNFATRMREEMMRMMGRIGDKLDRAVTLRDLKDSGLVKLSPGYLGGGKGNPIVGPGPGIGESELDLTPPPTPTGFALAAAISNVFVECDPQRYQTGHGHADTVLYGVTVAAGAPLPTFGDALELATFPGAVFAYATDPNQTWRMWLKWRSRDGVLSVDPAGGINGLEVKTGQDVARLVAAMTGPGNPFKLVPEQIVLPDGTVVPPGIYVSDGYFQNGFLQNAMIGKLAVDSANIASVSADKLTTGSLNVGSFIQSSNYAAGQSGFRIGGGGFFELSGGTFRGAIFAASGTFAGALVGATGTFSGDISAASGTFTGAIKGGAFTGYGWPASGGGFYLGAPGLLIGNANAGKYFQVTEAGDIYAPQFSIVNGSATFAGTLAINNGSANRVEIDSNGVRVIVGGVLRVRLGFW